MKSTLVNMILSLLGITLVASTGVALVYGVTEEPIAAAKRAKEELSQKMVLPEFDSSEATEFTIDELPITVYTAKSGDEIVGYAVQSSTKLGYSGFISMMVGISPEMDLLNVSILSHSETPGLGSKMGDEGNAIISSIGGKSLKSLDLRVKKDGGDIDALSGATISSRAYGDAVSRAYRALQQHLAEGGSSNE